MSVMLGKFNSNQLNIRIATHNRPSISPLTLCLHLWHYSKRKGLNCTVPIANERKKITRSVKERHHRETRKPCKSSCYQLTYTSRYYDRMSSANNSTISRGKTVPDAISSWSLQSLSKNRSGRSLQFPYVAFFPRLLPIDLSHAGIFLDYPRLLPTVVLCGICR